MVFLVVEFHVVESILYGIVINWLLIIYYAIY